MWLLELLLLLLGRQLILTLEGGGLSSPADRTLVAGETPAQTAEGHIKHLIITTQTNKSTAQSSAPQSSAAQASSAQACTAQAPTT